MNWINVFNMTRSMMLLKIDKKIIKYILYFKFIRL